MIYSALAHLLALLLDLLALVRRSDPAKDLEILALRQHLHLLQRTQPAVRPTRGEKLLLAVIVTRLKRVATRAGRPWQHNLYGLPCSSPRLCPLIVALHRSGGAETRRLPRSTSNLCTGYDERTRLG